MNATAGLVGIVGLGLVGRALAARLAQAGIATLGHDRRPEACAAWDGAVATLAEIGARCPRIVLAVFDTQGVLDVVAQIAAAPQLLVDCSTGDPDALLSLAVRLSSQGTDFIEAPLSGSSEQIARGDATMLLGADPAVLQRHAALLQALAPRRIAVGSAGMGARAKLATNLVLGLNRAALAEGIVFAERLGIAPDAFLELVLATPARSDAAVTKGRQMVDGDFAPRSRIHQHLKDLRLMLAQARAARQPLPLTSAHAALLRAAVDAGDGDLDNAAVICQIRRLQDPTTDA